MNTDKVVALEQYLSKHIKTVSHCTTTINCPALQERKARQKSNDKRTNDKWKIKAYL